MKGSAVQALAALWLVAFLGSFVAYGAAGGGGDDAARGLDRMAALLGWQGAALIVAALGALAAWRGAFGGPAPRLLGYGPLAVSLFVIVTLVALIAFQVLVRPAFG